jgi:predicted enzyme related to lactoylglutathione lyase
MNRNAICWVDIPVRDLDRAITFYSAVLGEPVTRESNEGCEFALLPRPMEGTSASLAVSKENEPSAKGPVIFLNVAGRLDEAISQVAPNGGTVVEPKHQIGPWGFAAGILDSEGNRIALHSPTP